jgi:hypothetical protein
VGDGGDPVAAPVFSCNASAVPQELPLPRLTKVQLQNTLQVDIQLADPTDAAAIWGQVLPTFNQYVPDLITPAPGDLAGGFGRTDQSIQQNQIDTMYQVGLAIGQQLTSSPSRLTAVLGACATDGSAANDQACLEKFIGGWGSRVLRYPLTQADVAYYAELATLPDGGSAWVAPGTVANVIAALINAPESLYRVEHGSDSNTVSALSPFELASRLSYQFSQGPPDDTLWRLALDGGLSDPSLYAQQVDRLLLGANAHQGLDEFVTQWLRLNELPPLDLLNTNPQFAAFAGAALPTATAQAGMVDDVLGAARQAVANGGTPSDFLKDNRSYAIDPYVAAVYGAAPWSGNGPGLVPPSSSRAGLLTRPGMLATGMVTTRPIHKGYQVRNSLLCEQVGAPPPNVNKVPPASTSVMTTRQVVTALTAGGVCGGCHPALIDPPGFMTENFDALGRERTDEQVFSPDGGLLASLPVDTSAVPAVILSDNRTMGQAAQLIAAIDASKLYHSCLARRYFRFTYYRNEDATADGCVLSDLEATARSGATLAQVLAHLVESPNYKQKRFQ